MVNKKVWNVNKSVELQLKANMTIVWCYIVDLQLTYRSLPYTIHPKWRTY